LQTRNLLGLHNSPYLTWTQWQNNAFFAFDDVAFTLHGQLDETAPSLGALGFLQTTLLATLRAQGMPTLGNIEYAVSQIVRNNASGAASQTNSAQHVAAHATPAVVDDSAFHSVTGVHTVLDITQQTATHARMQAENILSYYESAAVVFLDLLDVRAALAARTVTDTPDTSDSTKARAVTVTTTNTTILGLPAWHEFSARFDVDDILRTQIPGTTITEHM
jgi:hypothetical protein